MHRPKGRAKGTDCPLSQHAEPAYRQVTSPIAELDALYSSCPGSILAGIPPLCWCKVCAYLCFYFLDLLLDGRLCLSPSYHSRGRWGSFSRQQAHPEPRNLNSELKVGLWTVGVLEWQGGNIAVFVNQIFTSGARRDRRWQRMELSTSTCSLSLSLHSMERHSKPSIPTHSTYMDVTNHA